MTHLGWPHDLMTLAEFEALPEDNTRRYELQEGVLVVSPLPGPAHQKASFRVARTLYQQLSPEWDVLPAVEVITRPEFPANVRVPDVVVVADESLESHPDRFTADQILIAIEIVADGSRTTDTVMKPVEYAQAGIPHYWVIDPQEPAAAIYHLGEDGRYQQTPVVNGVLSVTEPFPLSLDLTELLSPQKRRVDQ